MVCFFGEAAVNNGAFHEALNMAALWKLPVIYLIENNRYGMGTALERASAINDIAERACSYDMPSEVVDGQDVLAVRAATMRALQRARSESIPTLLVFKDGVLKKRMVGAKGKNQLLTELAEFL